MTYRPCLKHNRSGSQKEYYLSLITYFLRNMTRYKISIKKVIVKVGQFLHTSDTTWQFLSTQIGACVCARTHTCALHIWIFKYVNTCKETVHQIIKIIVLSLCSPNQYKYSFYNKVQLQAQHKICQQLFCSNLVLTIHANIV